MSNWQHEWPTKPGMYWFYGWTHHKIIDGPDEPEMYLVQVRKVGSGESIYIEGHRFLYKVEVGEGMWSEATLPTPPKEIVAR